MKVQWHGVTWFTKLITAGLCAGMFGLGLYAGAQYTKATQPIPSVTYHYIYKEVPAVHSLPKEASMPTSTAPVPAPPPVQTASPSSSNETRFTAYITGYGWPDNTPPGGEVSNPVLHQSAGGTGSYTDPTTLAVGHTISGNTDTLDYPEGTTFYVPNLRRYFIVEDTCGDGNSPQNGPCHTGYQGHAWLDIWIGGEGANKSAVLSCEEAITDLFLVIQHPEPNYAVISGPVFNNSCSQQFGDTVVSL